MTLNEAIKHLDETLGDSSRMWSCEECRQEHIQLQEWLIELKGLREAREPRVMTLEEVNQCVYGMPYIIETNNRREEPRLMYGLYSHQGVNGCFYFAFTDVRSHFFDADYGKRWRCWTSRPDDKRRAETPWN